MLSGIKNTSRSNILAKTKKFAGLATFSVCLFLWGLGISFEHKINGQKSCDTLPLSFFPWVRKHWNPLIPSVLAHILVHSHWFLIFFRFSSCRYHFFLLSQVSLQIQKSQPLFFLSFLNLLTSALVAAVNIWLLFGSPYKFIRGSHYFIIIFWDLLTKSLVAAINFYYFSRKCKKTPLWHSPFKHHKSPGDSFQRTKEKIWWHCPIQGVLFQQQWSTLEKKQGKKLGNHSKRETNRERINCWGYRTENSLLI